MKNIVGLVFLMPFSFSFAAERPEQSPFVARGIDIGNTGTPRPTRANSLQRAQTIRVNLPRRTSSGDEGRVFHKSPRSKDDFVKERGSSAVLPKQPFDFSQPPVDKAIPSYGPVPALAEKK